MPGRGDILGVAGIPNMPTDIRIFDLNGSLVYESSASSRDDIIWDGVNMDNDPVASGVYLLQVEQDGSDFEQVKFALVR